MVISMEIFMLRCTGFLTRHRLWKLPICIIKHITIWVCSLGFSPKYHKYIATKIYDTRVGFDTEFSETLLKDKELLKIINVGEEFGTTTGRMWKVQWLNIDKLIKSINIYGTTIVIISKIDGLEKVKKYKLIVDNKIIAFETMKRMKDFIQDEIHSNCDFVDRIIFSNQKEITSL